MRECQACAAALEDVYDSDEPDDSSENEEEKVLSDDEFDAAIRQFDDCRDRRGAERADRRAEEYNFLTSHDQVFLVLTTRCTDCQVDCAKLCEDSEAAIQADRAVTCSYNLDNGDRRDYITSGIQVSAQPVAWGTEGSVRKRKNGTDVPKNKVHYVVNGKSVVRTHPCRCQPPSPSSTHAFPRHPIPTNPRPDRHHSARVTTPLGRP